MYADVNSILYDFSEAICSYKLKIRAYFEEDFNFYYSQLLFKACVQSWVSNCKCSDFRCAVWNVLIKLTMS